ncbi:hypothetical protein N9059_01500 [bacterium]|nr:hypothetical protein [bacterium]
MSKVLKNLSSLVRILWGNIWFKLIVVLLGIILFLISVSYQVINVMGAKEWESTKLEMIERGYPVNWDELVPTEIPDSENFAMSPLFRGLFDYEFMGGGEIDARSMDAAGAILDEKFTKDYYHTSAGSLMEISRITELNQKIKDSPERFSNQRTVEQILDATKDGLDEVELALQKPGSRFPVRYEHGSQARLSHLTYLKRIGKAFHFSMLKHLEDREFDKAFDDLIQIRKLAATIDDEPLLISQIVDSVLVLLVVDGIQEGIARGGWSVGQMRQLIDELKDINLLEQFARAMMGENLSQIGDAQVLIDGTAKSRVSIFLGMNLPDEQVLLPDGFFQLNRAAFCRVIMNHFITQEQIDNRAVPVSNPITSEEMYGHPNYIVATFGLPVLNSAEPIMLEKQAYLHAALLGLHLEIHLKKHGSLPEKLDELGLRESTLYDVDPATGNSLSYERIDDANFKIYSFGFDRVDGGGEMVFNDRGSPERNEGDWVWWRVPPEEGVEEELNEE